MERESFGNLHKLERESFGNLHKLNALMDNLVVGMENKWLKDIHTSVDQVEVFSCKESYIIGLLNIETRDQGDRSFWNEAFLLLALGSYG